MSYLRRALFCGSQLPKQWRAWGVLHILTDKCASRHSGVRFLQIETCKMAPSMRCFVHFDLQMCFAPQRRAFFPDRDLQNGSGNKVFCTFWLTNVLRATAIFLDRDLQNGSEHEVFCTFWLTNVLRATAACHFSGSWLAKWLREWGVLYILTYKCASRHSGVRLLQIETCKMAPTMRCFVHFDLQMCFAPQRRAIFPDRDLQNGSDHEVFCTFWLTNVLRATAACNFSYLFSAAPSAPAALTSLLCKHQNARIIEKTQWFATFLTFGAHVSSETWLLLYSCFPWLLCCATLFFCDLNTVRLCFSTLLFNCPYCRKLDL